MQLLFAGPQQQRALIRAEIRQDTARLNGIQTGGGDFYGPFWADVKEHVAGTGDLVTLCDQRMDRNSRRERLYPILAQGFLTWWNEHRRWTNEPFEVVRTPSASFKFNELLTLRVDNFLAVRDAHGINRYIYPYFYEQPALKNEAARISLWVFKNAFRALPFENFRILDVSRGQIFSPDRCYLEGDEKNLLTARHKALWDLYVSIEEGGQ